MSESMPSRTPVSGTTSDSSLALPHSLEAVVGQRDRSHWAVPPVLALLAKREKERRRLVEDLAQQRARVTPLRSVKNLRSQLQGFLSGWHDLLAANATEARIVLDGVLADRIRFEPDIDAHRYRLTLPIAFDRVLIAALPEFERVARNGHVPNGNQHDVRAGPLRRAV